MNTVVPFPASMPETVTKAEAARLLGVCRQTVYNYLANGLLQTTANGRVTTRSIKQFIKEETA